MCLQPQRASARPPRKWPKGVIRFIQPQITFPLPRLKQFQLPLTANKRDAKPPVYRPNRHGLVLQSPSKDAVIIGDTARCLEGSFCLAVKFICVCDFGNRPHRHLRRKAVLLPHRLIAFVVQVVLPKGFGFPYRSAHKLTGGIGLFQRVPERIGLFGRGKQFDMSYQLHANNCSTNDLKFQDLKLFLLACFDIPFDGFRTDVSTSTYVIAFCPQCCLFAPLLAAKAFKLFLQLAGCYSLEQTDGFSRRKFRGCAHKQVFMVGHHLDRQYLNTVLCGDFRPQFFQPCLDRSNQNPFSIAQYPDQVIVDYLRAVWAVVGFVWHTTILAKDGGFLHPL